MKNKFLVLFIASCICHVNSFAQTEISDLPKNRFFWGGSIVAGLGVGGSSNDGFSYTIGGIPEFGYSIAKPLDIGINLNLIYSNITFRDASFNRIRQSAFNYGVGAFTRLHIANTFFLQAMAEQNFFNYKQTAIDFPGNPSATAKVESSNILGGIGYGSRAVGEGGFYTVILLDLNKHPNSPYLINGQPFPIFRAGFIKYFRKKDKGSSNNSRVREF